MMLSQLLSAYRSLHPRLSAAERLDRLHQGFAIFCDLQLSTANQLLGITSKVASRALPIRTGDVQTLIDQLCELSFEDGLTGLWNRRYLERRLEQELLRARREHTSCAMALVDVDHFRRINDSYGRRIGDQVLKEIAELLRAALRATDDIAGRFGGEQFIVLLPDTDIEGAQTVAERLRQAVEGLRSRHLPAALTLTVSIGVANHQSSFADTTALDLTDDADRALHAAKKSGRNRVCILSAQLQDGGPTAVTHAERDALLG